MIETIIKLLHGIPEKAIAIIFSAILLAFTAVLIAVTIIVTSSNRAVDFWPPKVGSDSRLIAKVSALSDAVKNLNDREMGLRVAAASVSLGARNKAVDEISKGNNNAAKLLLQISQANDALILEQEAKLGAKIKELEVQVASLHGKL